MAVCCGCLLGKTPNNGFMGRVWSHEVRKPLDGFMENSVIA